MRYKRKVIPNQIIIQELDNGKLRISTKITSDEEILKIVRYWIPHVKVISPTFLQNKLEQDLAGHLNYV